MMPTPEQQSDAPPTYSLRQLIAYTLKLGAFGFGGPVALVGYMRRDLVEARHWISEADYKVGLTLAQLAPGPLAAQLAIYLGYVHYRIPGATLVGIAFVLPSFLMVVALGWAYSLYGGLNWMQSVFYGVGAAVIGIIAHTAFNLTKRTVGKDWLLWTVYVINAVFTAITESEVIWLIVGAGVLVWMLRAPPKRWFRPRNTVCLSLPLPLAMTAMPSANWTTLLLIAGFFAEAGAFVFGSGLAIVPFLYGGVVHDHHWLNDRQFLDAVAVALITPGPVVITVGFIGYLVAGLPGAVVAAFSIFLPCYLFTIIPAPYFKKYGQLPGIVAFVDGATSATMGAIAGAVVVLGRRSIFDLPTILILLATLSVLRIFKKLPEPLIILAAAFIGLLVYPALPSRG